MLRLLIYIAAACVLLFVYIKYLESRSIYFPSRTIEYGPDSVNLTFDDVYITTEDNLKINGWFIPHSNAEYTVLFLHGNAGNVYNRLDKILLLYEIGLNIFIIDYRGYGMSQGRPSEPGLYLDAKAAYDYLVGERKIRPEHIILYGESLGGAVAIDLGAKAKIGGLITEGTFSKGQDMARIMYPFLPPFLFSNLFDSLSKVKAIEAPKLFIHSRDDEMVPLVLARKLYDAAGDPKRLVEITGDHNNAFLDSKDALIASLTSFIKELTSSTS